MKKLLYLSMSLFLLFLIGCSSDDDGGDPGPVTPTVAVNSSVGSPSLTNPNDAVWDAVIGTSIEVSGANSPKIVVGKSASIPSTVQIKAITINDSLFMQFIWSDPDNDVWPNYFYVNDNTPPITFSWPGEIEHEDQLFVLFDGGTEFGWDVWNWRSLTTDGGDLAEGMKIEPNGSSPVADVGTIPVAYKNNAIGTSPTYVSKDTSEFNLNNDQPILVLGDELLLNSTNDSGTNIRDTQGWVLNQRIPGYMIDTTLKGNTTYYESRRSSRFDIRAASAYAVEEYTVVLVRKLNTGQLDDLNLSGLTTIKVKVGIFDDQDTFTLGSSNRGFTPDFDLNF